MPKSSHLRSLPLGHPKPLTPFWAVMHQLAFYPVLVTQGLVTKALAPRLQEPKGPRDGVAGEGSDLRLLILGDSSAAGVGVSTQSQALSGQLVTRLAKTHRVDWQLIARCGDTTLAALARLRAAQPRRADVAVTGLGVNDVTRGTRLSVWLDQQQALLDHLLDTVGVGHVYVSGLPPMGAFPRLTGPLRWTLSHQAARFDRALARQLVNHPNATHVPAHMALLGDQMASDGFHPGPMVYAEWARIVSRRIISDAHP